MIFGFRIPMNNTEALINQAKVVEKSLWLKQQERQFFHTLIAILKEEMRNIEKPDSKHTVHPVFGILLKETSKFPHTTIDSSWEYSTQKVNGIKAPTKKESGIDFFDHFRNEQHLRKPYRRFQKWMIDNSKPEIKVHHGEDERGHYALFYLDVNSNSILA